MAKQGVIRWIQNVSRPIYTMHGQLDYRFDLTLIKWTFLPIDSKYHKHCLPEKNIQTNFFYDFNCTKLQFAVCR